MYYLHIRFPNKKFHHINQTCQLLFQNQPRYYIPNFAQILVIKKSALFIYNNINNTLITLTTI